RADVARADGIVERMELEEEVVLKGNYVTNATRDVSEPRLKSALTLNLKLLVTDDELSRAA
ncbi:hypothetical protein THAOC_08784, partial [Thalassiosira oceanica]